MAHASSAPGLSAKHLYPPTAATDFLVGKPGNVAAVGATLRPGTSMVYGLRDLRGDDPARPRRFDAMYRHLGSTRTPFFHPVDRWGHSRLDQSGVRWVMTPTGGPGRAGAAPKDLVWRLAYVGDDARIYERPSARPEAWLTTSGAALTIHRPSNSRARIEGLGGADGRLVVSQAWAPGWTARIGDRVVEAIAHEGFLLALDLSEPVEAVEFVYRPPGFVAGAWISGLALLVVLWPLAPFARKRLNLQAGTTRIQSEASRRLVSSPSV